NVFGTDVLCGDERGGGQKEHDRRWKGAHAPMLAAHSRSPVGRVRSAAGSRRDAATRAMRDIGEESRQSLWPGAARTRRAARIYADSIVARRRRCPASTPPRAALSDANPGCAVPRDFYYGLLALAIERIPLRPFS